jgi:DnaJ-class molecular chaperone
LAHQNHPDRRGSTDIMSQLNEGYSILLDPERRAVFDAQYEEMQQAGDDAGLEAAFVDGYLETHSEIFSVSFRRQHEILVQRYQTQPLAQENIVHQHLQVIDKPMDVFLTSSISGLQGILQGDFTVDKMERVTAYALDTSF